MARALEYGLATRAARIATRLGRYWEARSSATEGRSWLDQAFAADSIPDADRARAASWAGQLAFFQGDLGAAKRLHEEAVALAQATGDVVVEATSLACVGWIWRELGEPDVGKPALNRSRALLAQLPDPWERSEIMLPLSAGEHGGGSGSARSTLEEVLALRRQVGDVIAVSDTLNNLGWDSMLSGDYDDAIEHLEETLAIALELEDTFRQHLAVCNLGLTAAMQERYDDAVQLLRESLLLSLRRGDRRGGTEALLGLAGATAGLSLDELAVRLDRIERALADNSGIVYPAILVERLGAPLRLAVERLGPERVASLQREAREPSLDLALELLDAQTTSIASPNE
jgi:tetratricopeptide (TPR) repeat protein